MVQKFHFYCEQIVQPGQHRRGPESQVDQVAQRAEQRSVRDAAVAKEFGIRLPAVAQQAPAVGRGGAGEGEVGGEQQGRNEAGEGEDQGQGLELILPVGECPKGVAARGGKGDCAEGGQFGFEGVLPEGISRCAGG